MNSRRTVASNGQHSDGDDRSFSEKVKVSFHFLSFGLQAIAYRLWVVGINEEAAEATQVPISALAVPNGLVGLGEVCSFLAFFATVQWFLSERKRMRETCTSPTVLLSATSRFWLWWRMVVVGLLVGQYALILNGLSIPMWPVFTSIGHVLLTFGTLMDTYMVVWGKRKKPKNSLFVATLQKDRTVWRHETSSPIENSLVEHLDAELRTHLFERVDEQMGAALARDFGVVAAWVRRISGSRGNLAVVVVSLPDSGEHPGKFAQKIKIPVGKTIGYFPVFNWLGLNLIITGRSVMAQTTDLDRYLSKFNNQRAGVLSIHVVDLSAMETVSARTWGLRFTGPILDDVEKAIEEFLNGQKGA